MRPAIAPELCFGLEDQIRAFERFGSNCGPGAMAGICGVTPEDAIAVMPEFHKRRATTEIMLTAGLTALGVSWKEDAARALSYGILRVQWDGPWMGDPDPYEKLRHSHWVGYWRGVDKEVRIFDVNAINVGGWLSFGEWCGALVPWLLESVEPEATGGWHFSDAYQVSLSPPLSLS